MTKDRRYSIAKKLILSSNLKTIDELIEAVPKTTIARDMGTNLARLNKMISNPLLFTFGDMVKIADLIEVDEKYIMDLVYNQRADEKKGKKRK
jgi:hypothetical protein